MSPFLLLGSLQPIANIFGAVGLLVGGLLTYGGIKINQATPKGWAGAVLSSLLLGPGILILIITAFLFFGGW